MATPEDMARRYAVKRFIPGQRDDAALARALEAARLAPSSFGLHPWRIVRAEDPQVRRAVLDRAYGQEKVVTAGHLLVFASRSPLTEDDVDAHVDLTARIRPLDEAAREKLRGTLVKNVLERHDAAGLDAWCRAQCYLGLGVFLSACATLRLDACPMEGFDPQAVTRLLGLDRERLTAQVLVTAGYGAPDDAEAARPKVRLARGNFVLDAGLPTTAQA